LLSRITSVMKISFSVFNNLLATRFIPGSESSFFNCIVKLAGIYYSTNWKSTTHNQNHEKNQPKRKGKYTYRSWIRYLHFIPSMWFKPLQLVNSRTQLQRNSLLPQFLPYNQNLPVVSSSISETWAAVDAATKPNNAEHKQQMWKHGSKELKPAIYRRWRVESINWVCNRVERN